MENGKEGSLRDTEQMVEWIERQAKMGARRAGTPAGLENEQFLFELLESFGLESLRKEPIPVTHWAPEKIGVEIVGGEAVPAFPIPYSAYTDDAGVEADLVYIDRKSLLWPADCRGAVVVTEIGFPELDGDLLKKIGSGHYDPDNTITDISHPATWVRMGWHVYHQAARRGAIGFIGILKDQPGGNHEMYGPYGFREQNILDKPIPGFWVGRDSGPALLDLAQKSGRVRITLGGVREPGTTHNVIGEIPGKSKDGEVIVLSCHHDSPFESPVEDASGIAVVLALAKHFAEARDLERRLIVLLTAGHFYGSIGTRTFIEEHKEVVARTALEISIEHIAKEAVEDASGKLVDSGQPEATGIFVPFNRLLADAVIESVEEHQLNRTLLLPAEGPLGDYPPTDGGDWFEAGVPLINYICNPVYLLTSDDAMQWVDRDRLPRVTEAFADIIRKVDGMEKAEIAKEDAPGRRLLMKVLKNIARFKTTYGGLKPVY